MIVVKGVLALMVAYVDVVLCAVIREEWGSRLSRFLVLYLFLLNGVVLTWDVL